MINLEQAKTLIGTTTRMPTGETLIIEKVRQLEDGKILVYNKHNWCCDVATLRDINGKNFNFNGGDSEN